jgi:hypothetical protein
VFVWEQGGAMVTFDILVHSPLLLLQLTKVLYAAMAADIPSAPAGGGGRGGGGGGVCGGALAV